MQENISKLSKIILHNIHYQHSLEKYELELSSDIIIYKNDKKKKFSCQFPKSARMLLSWGSHALLIGMQFGPYMLGKLVNFL